MQDAYHLFDELQEDLNAQKERRGQLISYWLVFIVVVLGALALPRLAVRLYGPAGFFITMILLTIILAVAGLLLLVQTIYNQREMREIKAALKEVRRKMRSQEDKRRWWRLWRHNDAQDDDHYYTIGADGELVEVDPDENKN